MAFELPEAPTEARRAWLFRWASIAIVVLLAILLAYLAVLGFAGSAQLVQPPDPSTDCRTPLSAFGWDYQAVNYDRASDDALSVNGDRMHCTSQASAAGAALTASDGIHLAAWYIPAGNGAGPSAATVIVAHDYGQNKSDMLERAAVLHDDYNLVLFDFRNHGQSGKASTTAGVNEQRDLRAIVDWVTSAKQPARLAVLGVSMGAAAAVNEAAGDTRIMTLILDSAHATLANAIQARLERAGYPLALPGAWSILFGGLLRTGQDMSAVDPVQAIARYASDGGAALIVAAGQDRAVGAGDARDLRMAALDAGGSAELEVCPSAAHDEAPTACANEYRTWVLGFLGGRLGP